MENTPIDIKFSSVNFRPNQKKFESKITLVDMMEWAKNISRYCPFKDDVWSLAGRDLDIHLCVLFASGSKSVIQV
jgi:hypothetical protein